jgi:hypothetical protein
VNLAVAQGVPNDADSQKKLNKAEWKYTPFDRVFSERIQLAVEDHLKVNIRSF